MMKHYLIFGLLLTFNSSIGQFAINNTGALPDASAMLDLDAAANTKGLLIPRMTKAERTAIVSPALGLTVYQTDAEEGYFHYTGAAWDIVPKLTDGTVTMGAVTSTIDYGTGFTVTRLTDGQDFIQFLTPLSAIPSVIVTNGTSPGTAPESDSYCFSNFSACTNHNIRTLRVDYNNNGTDDIVNDNSGCNANSNRYFPTTPATTPALYPLAQPSQTANGVAIMKITTRVDINLPTTAIAVWIDLDQSGGFVPSEKILAYAPSNSASNVIFNYVPPSSVCNGNTTMRVVARVPNIAIAIDNSATILSSPCNQLPPTYEGESEDYIITFNSLNICSFPSRQAVCNVGAVTNIGFKVSCAESANNAPKNVDKYHFIVTEN
jgi:GEVED domain